MFEHSKPGNPFSCIKLREPHSSHHLPLQPQTARDGAGGRQLWAVGCDVLVGAVVLPDGVVCVSGSTFPVASLRNQTEGLVSASDGFRGTALLFDQTGKHEAGRQAGKQPEG